MRYKQYVAFNRLSVASLLWCDVMYCEFIFMLQISDNKLQEKETRYLRIIIRNIIFNILFKLLAVGLLTVQMKSDTNNNI